LIRNAGYAFSEAISTGVSWQISDFGTVKKNVLPLLSSSDSLLFNNSCINGVVVPFSAEIHSLFFRQYTSEGFSAFQIPDLILQ